MKIPVALIWLEDGYARPNTYLKWKWGTSKCEYIVKGSNLLYPDICRLNNSKYLADLGVPGQGFIFLKPEEVKKEIEKHGYKYEVEEKTIRLCIGDKCKEWKAVRIYLVSDKPIPYNKVKELINKLKEKARKQPIELREPTTNEALQKKPVEKEAEKQSSKTETKQSEKQKHIEPKHVQKQLKQKIKQKTMQNITGKKKPEPLPPLPEHPIQIYPLRQKQSFKIIRRKQKIRA